MTRLRDHAEALRRMAAESAERAAAHPNDWMLKVVSDNQHDAAEDAARAADLAEATARGELVEWRFSGNRLRLGALPLEFLARLAAPLNNLLVKAAFYSRTGTEAVYGAADALSREVNLSLVALEPGSTKLLIRGQVLPDTTGDSALQDGLTALFSVLTAGQQGASDFYESIDDIGVRAASALEETLKAIEQEEASVEITWRRAEGPPLRVAATFDRVVQMRALLEGVEQEVERAEQLSGAVSLLSNNGRIELTLATGERVKVRYRPRSQGTLVARLTLNSVVNLQVTARVHTDPITGEEVSRYSLVSLEAPLLKPPN